MVQQKEYPRNINLSRKNTGLAKKFIIICLKITHNTKMTVFDFINNLEKHNSSKYLYVYGENGIGKTTIINDALLSIKKLDPSRIVCSVNVSIATVVADVILF